MANISITFNYNNGNPTWNVNPTSLRVPPGNSPLNWNLSGSGATFPSANAIVFPAPGDGSKNANPWPGTMPVTQNVNKVTANDQNNLRRGDPPQTFHYIITVMYGGNAYFLDPDVTNDPPTGGGGEDDPEPMPPSPRPD